MADGKGCVCAAKSSSDCACDADWTPREVYELRGFLDRMADNLKLMTMTHGERRLVDCLVIKQTKKLLEEYEAMRGVK